MFAHWRSGLVMVWVCGAWAASKPATFAVSPEYSAGVSSIPYGYGATGPTPALSADLNHDGFGDFVTVDATAGTVVVVLGGSKGFQAPTSFTAVSKPAAIASGDFNNDGNADLVVAGDTTVVLLGNGDGTFQAPLTIFPFATYIAVGDFNGDGNADVALAGGNLLVALGNGNGTFQPLVATTLANPFSLYPGDFHNNGRDDLIVVQRQGPVFMLSSNGNGTFQAGPPLFNLKSAMAVADMNQDGNLDLVTAAIDVWLGDGHGNFTRVARQKDALIAGYVAVADVNGDGVPDVVTADWGGSVSIFLGRGGGQLDAGYSYNANSGGPWLAVGRYSAASQADVVVFGYSDYYLQGAALALLRNVGGGHYAGLRNLPVNGGVYALGDVNQDGILDLVVADTTDVSAPALWILPGLGNGAFGRPIATVALSTYGTSTVVADFNGDGRPDFAVTLGAPTTSVIEVGLQQPGNQFQIVTTSLAVPVQIVWAGDLNGDGLPDLVLVNVNCFNSTTCGTIYTAMNTGDGSFASPVEISTSGGSGAAPSWVAAADFNNDGKPDLAIGAVSACGTQSGPAVLLGNGDGTFGSPICLAGSSAYTINAGDFNGDGNQDVAIVGNPPLLYIYLGNGRGGFQALPAQTLSTGGLPDEMLAADFNGDGHMDLAAISAGGGAVVQVYLGNGTGTFAFDQLTYAGAGTNCDAYYGCALAGDLNNDGKVDVLSLSGGMVSTLLNTTR